MRFVPWAQESSICFICAFCRCQNINAALADLRAHISSPLARSFDASSRCSSAATRFEHTWRHQANDPVTDMRANLRTTRSMAAALAL